MVADGACALAHFDGRGTEWCSRTDNIRILSYQYLQNLRIERKLDCPVYNRV